MQIAVKGNAKVVSHHEWQEYGTRRLGMFRNVAGDAGRDRGYSSSFQGALHERDRLMTDGSGRRGKRDVGSFFRNRVCNVLGERPLEPLGVHVVADERVEILCQATDYTFGRKFA